MSTTLKRRNAQIVQQNHAGIPRKEIASKFKLSSCRIAQIVHQADATLRMAAINEHLRQCLHLADDLEKPWPTMDLINLFVPMTTTNKGLLWALRDTKKISIKEMMDMVISDENDSRPECLKTPMLKICNIGSKGFWSVINCLSDLDYGTRCKEEWVRRRTRLYQAWRIRGPKY